MTRTLPDLQNIALNRNWQLNPNEKIVILILKKANQNKTQYGEYYCPCKLQRIPSNICPCDSAQQEINRDGHCHCNLFYKKEG